MPFGQHTLRQHGAGEEAERQREKTRRHAARAQRMFPAGGEPPRHQPVVDQRRRARHECSLGRDLAGRRVARQHELQRQRPEDRRAVIGEKTRAGVAQIRSALPAGARPVKPMAGGVDRLQCAFALALREQPERRCYDDGRDCAGEGGGKDGVGYRGTSCRWPNAGWGRGGQVAKIAWMLVYLFIGEGDAP